MSYFEGNWRRVSYFKDFIVLISRIIGIEVFIVLNLPLVKTIVFLLSFSFSPYVNLLFAFEVIESSFSQILSRNDKPWVTPPSDHVEVISDYHTIS